MQNISCKPGESIRIGDVAVTVLSVSKNRVKFGIDGPRNIPIRRSELAKFPELVSVEQRKPLPR